MSLTPKSIALLPKYPAIIALCLMIAMIASMFVLQYGWLLLLSGINDLLNTSFIAKNTLTIMSLILTAVSLVWIIVIWQYLRIKTMGHTTKTTILIWQCYFGFYAMNSKAFFKALAILLVGIILSSGFVAILSDWLKPMPSIDVKSLVDDSTPMWLFALLVLICAPIYEELICRGLFWRLGEDIFSPFFTHQRHTNIAVSLLSSGIFSFLHFQYNYIDLVMMATLSLILCYARLSTQSIFAPMLLHSINNSLVLLLMIFS